MSIVDNTWHSISVYWELKMIKLLRMFCQIFVSGEEERWLYGSYSCIAKNIYGYVTDSATLVEAGACPVLLGTVWSPSI